MSPTVGTVESPQVLNLRAFLIVEVVFPNLFLGPRFSTPVANWCAAQSVPVQRQILRSLIIQSGWIFLEAASVLRGACHHCAAQPLPVAVSNMARRPLRDPIQQRPCPN